MNIVDVAGFAVIGRQARTSNAREMSGKGVIGGMWSKGAPAGSPVVAVYSGYESDKDGEYNYLLGRKAIGDETTPRELAYQFVESGKYVRLHFEGEVSPETVVGLWQQIWHAETLGTIKRAYKTDFELYNQNGFELFVGVL